MKHFDVVTLFPGMFDALTLHGITQRARDRGLFQLVLWNPRDFSSNSYKSVDDRPYGGGPGMVMTAEPLAKALQAAKARQKSCGLSNIRSVYMSPQGRRLDQAGVEELGKIDGLVVLAGRYEGVDERLIEAEIDQEISIGDYVLSGGELPAMTLLDAIIRRIPGVVNDAESVVQESFVSGLLDCPHFTRPEAFRGVNVPPVLMSGNHAEISRWRLKQSLGRTWQRRPDLLGGLKMNDEQHELLEEYKAEFEVSMKSGAGK